MPPKVAENSKKRMKRSRSHSSENSHMATACKITSPKAAKWPRGLRGPNGMKLKQLQYHKFDKDILIYHYQASFITVSSFRSLLTRQQHGYVNSLLGPDPLSSTPTPSGDEPPSGCLEVGYLPSIFHLGGSALGFRMPSSSSSMIEWFCFDRDIQSSILEQLDIDTETAHMLFEHVATLARPPPPDKKWSRKVAYTEHKDWWESLRDAGRRPFKLGLAWGTFGTELMMDGLEKRDELVKLRERREVLGGLMATGAEHDGMQGEFYGCSDVEEEEEEAGHIHKRDTDTPETLGRHTPFVYRDSVPYREAVPGRPKKLAILDNNGTQGLI